MQADRLTVRRHAQDRSSGPGGDRTHIPLFKRQVLRRLSYKAIVQCVGQELNLHSNAGGLQPLGLANAQPTHLVSTLDGI